MMKNLYAVDDIIQYNAGIKNKLSEICEPIFNSFGFTGFGYTRIQKNGDRLILETNQDWINHYSDTAFEEKKEANSSLVNNLETLIINPPLEEFHIQMLVGQPRTQIQEQLRYLNIWNSVSIYVNMNRYLEVYHLSMSKENQEEGAIIDLCVNKKFLLHRFFHYFREKLRLLEVEKAPCIRDVELSKIFLNKTTEFKKPIDDNISNYMKQTYVDKFYLKTHDIFIGRREAECLHYLALGETCKEIANRFKISPRTVESYISSLKSKTNLHIKGELIKLAYENLLATPGMFESDE